jgi:TonB family protein
MLADARRRLLPEMARRRIAEGRLAYQQGDRSGATQRFEGAIRLLEDPTLANQRELADLKALASGFLDLIRAQSAPAVAPAAATPPADVATPASAREPAAPAPAPAPAAGQALAVSRPTVVSQSLPPWRPPDPSWRTRELRGSVLLSIDATGRVTSATMQQTVYPGYDRLLLEAARTWRYTPAMREGQPTPSQLIVPIVIRPSE